MDTLMSVVAWVTSNLPVLLGVAYGLLNLLNAVLTLVPGDQGEGESGWLSTVRKVLDRVSVLTNSDAVGTVKAPLTKSKSTK